MFFFILLCLFKARFLVKALLFQNYSYTFVFLIKI